MINDKYSIVILIEHKAREFAVACIIKMLLETRYNYSVYIKSTRDRSNINSIRPQIVLTPFFRTLNSIVFPFIYTWSDAKIINLNYEQIFRPHQLTFRKPTSEFVKNEVIHLTWSENYKQFLIDNGVNDQNIFVNGNLQYQLYKPPYNNLFLDKNYLSKKYDINKNKPWVFFPENYGAIFGGDKSVFKPVEQDKDISLEVQLFVKKSYEQTMKWIHHIISNSDINLIIRPRPMTPTTDFVKYYKKINKELHPNLHFIKEGNARDWILSSDLIISNYSTTLIESALSEKPTYMLQPFPLPKYMISEWFKLLPKIQSLKNFEQLIQNQNYNSNKDHKLKKWANKNISPEYDVIEKLVDFIHQESNTHKPIERDIDKYYKNENIIIPKPIGLNYHLRNFIVQILRKSKLDRYIKRKHSIHSDNQKFNYINDKDIYDEIKKWESLIN
tara:strand:+ start:148 stop:1476 length:1329 start_codon:yes stop_codon:yes gene_type:complete